MLHGTTLDCRSRQWAMEVRLRGTEHLSADGVDESADHQRTVHGTSCSVGSQQWATSFGPTDRTPRRRRVSRQPRGGEHQPHAAWHDARLSFSPVGDGSSFTRDRTSKRRRGDTSATGREHQPRTCGHEARGRSSTVSDNGQFPRTRPRRSTTRAGRVSCVQTRRTSLHHSEARALLRRW